MMQNINQQIWNKTHDFIDDHIYLISSLVT